MNKSKITGVILSLFLLSFWACKDSSTGNSEDKDLPVSSSVAAISSSSETDTSSTDMSSSKDDGTSFSVVKPSSSSTLVTISSSQLMEQESSSSESAIDPSFSSSATQTAEVDPSILGNWIQVDFPYGETARTLEITTEYYDSGNNGMFVGTNKWSTFFAHDGFIGQTSKEFGSYNWVAYTLSKDTLYVVEGGTSPLPSTTTVILNDPATLKFFSAE